MFGFKSKIFRLLGLFLLFFFATPITSALTGNHNIGVIFKDSEGDPITTALDLRISLWDSYDIRDEDIDTNGNINTSALHYGGYQITFTITPDADSYFVPVSYGYYRINVESLTDFPEIIGTNNAFLQLEYKNQGDPNTSYQDYDFVDDPPWQNMSRYLLVSNVSYFTYDAGSRTNCNTFTLDSNNNASTKIELQFGEILAESLEWNKTNVRFELSNDLYVDGALELNGNLDFNLNQLVEVRVENLSSAPSCDAGSKGRLYYNTTDNLIYFCNGTSWSQL